MERWASDLGYRIVHLDDLDPVMARYIHLRFNGITMDVGETERVIITVFPDYDHPVITWSSSNPEVVSVEDGMVKALKKAMLL